MEYRHTVSEPRPVAINGRDGHPSWEVDILRDDTVIVDTFLLNNDVLPPRTNKRGKILWRLPDQTEKMPSFGTDDRRRILDIFKERKKKRKQEKKKGNPSPAQNGDPEILGKCERRDSSSTSPGGGGTGSGRYERQDSHNKPPGEKESSGAQPKAKIKGEENGKSSTNFLRERDGHGFIENGKGPKHKTKDSQAEGRKEGSAERFNGPQHSRPFVPPNLPPPGLGTPPIQASQGTNSSMLPASGQHRSQTHSTQLHPQVPRIPDPSRMNLNDSQETLTPPQSQSSLQGHFLSSQTPFTDSPPSDALFVTVPRIERSESLLGQPNSSLAVPAARHFISKYYAHFDSGLPGAPIGDLIRYYTSKAQKSVSIGGAHSVVTGRGDIAAQILNLAGTVFVVRGVVAQDTADGRGVHILVTGTARTGLNGAAGGVVASFAHSVSLVPTDNRLSVGVHGNNDYGKGDGICPALLEALEIGFPFQIHNDALALLSGDAGPVTPSPVQQPVQMQQLPPPPPGMF